jgi:uncharacterized Fe-S cluster protein YjdI
MNGEPTRVYERDGLAVEWRDYLCVHCGECTNGLPQVFNMQSRPWVNVNAASPHEIKEQVRKCPSGALSIR